MKTFIYVIAMVAGLCVAPAYADGAPNSLQDAINKGYVHTFVT